MLRRRCHRVPGAAIFRGQFRIGCTRLRNSLSACGLVRDQRALHQGQLPALERFQRILHAEQQGIRRRALRSGPLC